jgi:hypothetical protein
MQEMSEKWTQRGQRWINHWSEKNSIETWSLWYEKIRQVVMIVETLNWSLSSQFSTRLDLNIGSVITDEQDTFGLQRGYSTQ